ncbi:hypothetical protein CC1G_07494 [Coprinopsis cinerea okayama7|uniref:Uncharacterized protein n=1 Tax=Coprinopsis cinerea (strain Okayama-7 / 130 / ATCC MYA-4618 / FGSC 9003) TaxID=240176 RepID=A8P116_COPC7|nr:hypothetical protein CC1G_07494 [Coprinopsis cinerea okayama7\|eukprot:XP_001838004.2 hypothetical protein CC1G_07494 [Coprinopsis cinerea okayama7\
MEELIKDKKERVCQSGFVAAPALSSLYIHHPSRQDFVGGLRALPLANGWRGLTELYFNGWDPYGASEIFSVLVLCASTLRFLDVSMRPPEPSQDPLPAHIPKIAFPNLQHLSITETAGGMGYPPHLHWYMEAMQTPSLASLKFETSCDPIEGPSSLLAFLKANQGNLTKLANVLFEYNFLSPEDLAAVLNILGGPGMGVSSLVMQAADVVYRDMGGPFPYAIFWDSVLEKFNPGPDRPALFTKLRHFACEQWKYGEFGPEDLLEFVKYRVGASSSEHGLASLEMVEVTFVCEETIDVEEELKASTGVSAVQFDLVYGEEQRWGNI